MKSVTYDKEKISLNLARLKKAGETFEIDVNPELAIQFKEGEEIDIKDILNAEKIFADAKKGMLASETAMQTVFETDDELEIAKIILTEGEIQLTAEHRQKIRNQKRKKILDTIHRNGVDPKSKLPHPMQRLENAFEEAKIKIDEHKSIEKQVSDILKKLRPILPIKFGTTEIALTFPGNYAAKSYSTVKGFGTIKKEEWKNDGSWFVVIEIPSGMQNDFYEQVNSVTHGQVESKILKTS